MRCGITGSAVLPHHRRVPAAGVEGLVPRAFRPTFRCHAGLFIPQRWLPGLAERLRLHLEHWSPLPDSYCYTPPSPPRSVDWRGSLAIAVAVPLLPRGVSDNPALPPFMTYPLLPYVPFTHSIHCYTLLRHFLIVLHTPTCVALAGIGCYFALRLHSRAYAHCITDLVNTLVWVCAVHSP